jgi:hypothetical protein
MDIFGMEGGEKKFHPILVSNTVFHCQRKLKALIISFEELSPDK